MPYYKKCICGHFNTYEKQGLAPPYCEKCNRQLLTIPEESGEPIILDSLEDSNNKMYLECDSGIISINGETVVGRNSNGKELLKDCPHVSRKQFVIIPRSSGIAATITDVSTYSNTFLNGEKIGKDNSKIITNGGIINLANEITFKFVIRS